MQRHSMSDGSLAQRVTRALAVGFSLTALGLNACLLLLPRARGPQPEPTESAHRRSTSHVHAPSLPPQIAMQLSTARASGDGAALNSLFELESHGSQAVASAALDGIAQIGGERARYFLVQRLGEAPDAELSNISQALAQLSDPLAREALRAATHSARASVRGAAFEALSTLDTDDVRDFMLARLTPADAAASIAYFADCREPRALPALEQLARQAPAELRSSVLEALFAQGRIAEAATERLLRADAEVCDAVLDTRPLPAGMRGALRQASIARLRAGGITTGSVFDFLEQDLSSDAREALVEAAHEPASAERALSALSTRGDRASLDALDRLSHDSDRGLSARAQCALWSQPDSRTQRVASRVAQRGT